MGIIKTTRSHVAMNCSTILSGIAPVEYSALVIVELFPIVKSLKNDEDAADYQRLLTILEKVRNLATHHNYSKNSVVELVKDNFLSNTSIEDLKDIIKDSPYCWFPESLDAPMNFKSVSANPPKLRADYGQEDYCRPVGGNRNDGNESSSTVFLVQTIAPDVAQESIGSEQSLSSEARGTTMYNNEAEELLSSLRNAVDSRENAKHTWQWLLSIEEYERIKEFVSLNKIPTSQDLGDSFSLLLRLYIGEFYKRQWDGNNNPFSVLDDSNNSNFRNYKLICERTALVAYKKTNNVYQQSLYVDGGLPIHYISSKLDNNSRSLFVDSLSYLLDEDDIAMIQGESLLEKSTSSTALRESFHQGIGHSIYDYISAIRAKKHTWNDSDNIYPSEYSEFVNKVKEARERQEKRKKFSIRYTLWAYKDGEDFNFTLFPSLRFNPEDNTGKRHFGITQNKLSEWGIEPNETQFELQIGDERVLFSWCAAGDYISQGLVTQVDFPQINKSEISSRALLAPQISVCFPGSVQKHTLPSDSVVSPARNGLVQFYTDEDPSMGVWTSFKGNRSFPKSSVLYDKNRYTLESSFKSLDINEQFAWVVFDDEISFYDKEKGKSVELYNRKSNIYTEIPETCLHPIVNNPLIMPECISNGVVNVKINGGSTPVSVIRSQQLKFNIFNSESDEQLPEDGFSIDYRQKFADDQEADWKEYDASKTRLNQGLYDFRLRNKTLSTIHSCYVFPEEASVSADLSDPNNIKISFKDIDGVTSNDSLSPTTSRNSTSFFIRNNQDSYCFTIGLLQFKIYHPRPQTHVFFKGKELKEEKTSLILAFAEDIRISYISSKGSATFFLSENEKIYKTLFNALTQTAREKANNGVLSRFSLGSFVPEIKASDYKIRIYTQEIDNNEEIENLFLLNFSNNELIPISSKKPIDAAKGKAHNCFNALLFQSLKGIDFTESCYQPKFISKFDKREDRRLARTQRLDKYVDDNYWSNPYTFVQFEIACEHKLYFAVFDSLISILWDNRKNKKCFFDITKSRERTIVERRLSSFLSQYVKYCEESGRDVNCQGLLRLSKEFRFKWNILDQYKKDFDNNTLSIYNKIAR